MIAKSKIVQTVLEVTIQLTVMNVYQGISSMKSLVYVETVTITHRF